MCQMESQPVSASPGSGCGGSGYSIGRVRELSICSHSSIQDTGNLPSGCGSAGCRLGGGEDLPIGSLLAGKAKGRQSTDRGNKRGRQGRHTEIQREKRSGAKSSSDM